MVDFPRLRRDATAIMAATRTETPPWQGLAGPKWTAGGQPKT